MIPHHSHLIEGVTGGKAGGAERFRRLKWNELVTRGDFVEDRNQGFEPWAGPGGFRADSFVKPIYRRAESVRSQPKNKMNRSRSHNRSIKLQLFFKTLRSMEG